MPLSRPITVDTPLDPQALTFYRMSAREELGRLFEYNLEFLSNSGQIALNTVVGKPVTVNIEIQGGVRHLNGIVSRFTQAPPTGGNYHYRATLRPSLWLLTRTAGCRIFQAMTAADIIKKVFRDYGFPFEANLQRTCPTREYCVQYRETDFDFVSRLMEEEGIYYFFTHAAGQHTLHLVDAPNAHSPATGYTQVPYRPYLDDQSQETDCIHNWELSEQLEPGAVALTDFDFKRPKANLLVKQRSSNKLAKPAYEIYDYPGYYVESADGQAFAGIRMDELWALQELVEAEGTVRGLGVGETFSLIDHPREDQNRENLVVSMDMEAHAAEYGSGSGGGTVPTFRCAFRAIESRRQYRTPRTTAPPLVRGPQTAIVVGPSGDEIYTDQYGRVKLKFHWDRRSQADEESSCWVRVSQVWAGGKWGSIHIPRIGQEVVVSFLEGDPDRPLVTGRVYNGVNTVPYALPANMTQSGIKSRSSKNGNENNFNELRFEDKKGSEQVYLQAEKNLDIYVKNDETHTTDHDRTKLIKHDETTTIGHNRTEEVKNDEVITIDGNRTEEVKKDETITIDGNRTEEVKKDETITIDGNRTETVKKDESVTIQGQRTETVSKDETITIQGKRTETVSKDETITIEGKRTETVSKDETITIQGKRTVSVTGNDKLDVTGKIAISSVQELSITVGAASLTMKASGEITLAGVKVTVQGATVTVAGDGATTVQAGGALTLQGASITQK